MGLSKRIMNIHKRKETSAKWLQVQIREDITEFMPLFPETEGKLEPSVELSISKETITQRIKLWLKKQIKKIQNLLP